MADEPVVRLGRGGEWLTLRRDDIGADDFTGRPVVWSLNVDTELVGLRGTTKVWVGPPEAQLPLEELFAAMSAEWRGWAGAKTWKAFEGGLALSCTHDRVGTVTIAFTLRKDSGLGWQCDGELRVDAGQLEQLANDVRQLFAVASNT